MKETRIVIAGGGFAGLYTAFGLEKIFRKDRSVSITLLNSENFFLFTPMLPEAAASSIGTRHIVSPLRKLLHKTRVAEVSIESIDFNSRTVRARHSLTAGIRKFSFDHLVLALGGVTSYFNIPGADEHSIPIKTLGDAIFIRNHVIDNLEEAAVEPERSDELLTIVVVGGGLTGVEVTGALNDFIRDVAGFYPEVNRSRIRVMLVEAGPRLMAEMNGELAAFSKKVLERHGVEVRTGTRVTSVEADAVTLSTGERVPTRTLVWSAGVGPNPLLNTLDLPRGPKGRIKVDEFLQVEGMPGVWALGDCAEIPNPETGKSYPPTAQHAVRQGRRAAQNIAASLGQGRMKPYDYQAIGQMALVGERRGVAQIMSMRFSGFFAWFLWRTYYVMQIPQLEKRIRVILDWTLDLFFKRDLVQLAVTRARELAAEPGPAGALQEPKASSKSTSG